MTINYFIVKDVNNTNKFFVIIKNKYTIAYHSRHSMPLYNAQRFIYELENGLIPIIIHPVQKVELPLSKEFENKEIMNLDVDESYEVLDENVEKNENVENMIEVNVPKEEAVENIIIDKNVKKHFFNDFHINIPNLLSFRSEPNLTIKSPPKPLKKRRSSKTGKGFTENK